VLRALDEQRFLPVGAAHPVHVDVRVIAATNKDLEEEIARGNFREDLFYRLNVIPFYVPPLRDRKEDIPLLVKEFFEEFGPRYGRTHVEITEDALTTLRQYHWPGNVRELRNLVERVLILNPKVQRIEKKHLPMLVYRGPKLTESGRINTKSEEFSSLVEAREAYEREFILKKLDEFHGNVSRAAEGLGLERSHLYRKMKALGVTVKAHAEGVSLVVCFDLGPRNGASGLCGLASHHAAASAFDSRGDLVLELSAGDALDEAAILHCVGLGEVVGEGAIGSELTGSCRCAGVPLPRLIAKDAKSTAVGSFGEAFGSKEAL
jgi:hypothetical protein